METYLQEFLNTLKTNTVLQADVDEGLNHAIIRNYSNLLSEQYSQFGIKKYNCTLKDFKTIDDMDGDYTVGEGASFKVGYTIPDTLFDYTTKKELQDKKLLKRLVTHTELTQTNRKLFKWNVLVFIGTYLLDGLDVYCDDDESIVVLPVLSNRTGVPKGTSGIPFVHPLYGYKTCLDYPITIYRVPNYYSTTFIGNTFPESVQYSYFDYNKTHIDKNTLFFYSCTESGFMNYGMKAFMNYTSTDTQSDMNVRTSNIGTGKTNFEFKAISFDNFELKSLSQVSNQLDYWSKFSDYDKPVPIDNILPLIPITNNSLSDAVSQYVKFSLYYPNTYQITIMNGLTSPPGIDTMLMYGVFYKDDSWVKTDNKFKLFEKYFPDSLSMYQDGTIPDVVKDFTPYEIPYYTDIYKETVNVPNSFPYQISKLNEYIQQDPDILVAYLYYKLRGKNKIFIDISKFSDDLPGRIRLDNSKEFIPYDGLNKDEVSGVFNDITFTEPCYLFTFHKVIFGTEIVFRFFLDGKYLHETDYYMQLDGTAYHLYIPTRLVHSDSVLEIEKFYDYSKTINTAITISGTCLIDLSTEETPLYMGNLHVYETETKKYIPKSDYKVTRVDNLSGNTIDMVHDLSGSLNDVLTLRFQDTKYCGKDISVVVETIPTTYYTETHYPYNDISILDINELQTQNIRIYTDGLFHNPYVFVDTNIESGNYNSTVDMSLRNTLEYEKLSVDTLPYTNKLEFIKIGEFCTDDGFVNTKNSLSLPIDLKWYDVYVNGIRLNKSNIEIISPNKFFVKGIDSKKNLEIWLRGTPSLEFKFENYNSTLNDKIWDIDYIQKVIRESQDILNDTLVDIYADVPNNDYDEWVKFIEDYFPKGFINPNIAYWKNGFELLLTKEMTLMFPTLFNSDGVMMLNPNRDTQNSTTVQIKYVNSNEMEG